MAYQQNAGSGRQYPGPADDERIDRALRTELARLSLDGLAPDVPFAKDMPLDQSITIAKETDTAFAGIYKSLPLDPTLCPRDISAIAARKYTVIEPTGVEIPIEIFQTRSPKPQPCLIYYHGGGMTILDAFLPPHRRWCTDLALAGCTVILAGFRNAYVPAGLNPFPAGLSDCVSIFQWVQENREQLSASSIIVQGESGGANLALATTLQLRNSGMASPDGISISCPYISGMYGATPEAKAEHLPSLLSNDGYFLNVAAMAHLARIYDPLDSSDPLCWPYHAPAESFRDFPPVAISVNELDPLLDEGIALYRKLLAAGVQARLHMNFGLTHVAEFIFRGALPNHYDAKIADIVSFAKSLAQG